MYTKGGADRGQASCLGPGSRHGVSEGSLQETGRTWRQEEGARGTQMRGPTRLECELKVVTCLPVVRENLKMGLWKGNHLPSEEKRFEQ